MRRYHLHDFVIVGAGITGLSLAYSLKQAGFDVCVVDSSNSAGGLTKTHQIDGFTIEQGPQALRPSPAVLELIDKLELADQLIFQASANQRQYIAASKGLSTKLELQPCPNSLREFLRSPCFSPWAKLRVLLEPMSHVGSKDDESIRAFMERRVGREVTDKLVAALITGVWAGDIRDLSCKSTLAKAWFFEKEHGSLRRGIRKNYAQGFNQTPLISFKQGMSTLIETLAEAVGEENIFLDTSVEHLELDAACAVLQVRKTNTKLLEEEFGLAVSSAELQAKQVILTTPAYATAALLSDTNPQLAALVNCVPYAPVGIAHLAYKKANIGKIAQAMLPPITPSESRTKLASKSLCSGICIPPTFSQALLGATFNSVTFTNRAPEDELLVTCFSGGATNPELADVTRGDILEVLIDEVSDLLQSSVAPKVIQTSHLHKAVPNYAVGHSWLQEKLNRFHQSQSQIQILGNWINGIDISGRIEESKRVANQLIYGSEAAPTAGDEKSSQSPSQTLLAANSSEFSSDDRRL